MKQPIGKLILLIGFFFSFQLNASHITGGYLSYKCLGSINANDAEYEITMYFYRDCENGNPGTEPTFIPLTVFAGTTFTFQTNLTNLISSDTIPDDINNPCVASSPMVCVEEYVFRDTVILPRNQAHTLVYQRCCKNTVIDNLNPPSGLLSDYFGNTFLIDIPRFNTLCNNTPDFNSFPPILLCSGFDVNLDLSATDADGDSLVYSLCAPIDFNQDQQPNGNPAPIQANAPPYTLLPFAFPQTPTNPIPSSPAITINPNTGRLTGTATNVGNYALGFCVEEYRNGALINTFRREIQITTQVCNPVVNSVVQDQMQFCDGFGVQFRNNTTTNLQRPSNQLDYIWDFGVPGTNLDTSTAFEPFFTYPAAGIYTITLIINPDFPSCRDTTTELFEVRPELNPIINQSGKLCVVDNSVNFAASGTFGNMATFEWDFGNQASISSSTNTTVNGVMYPGLGNYPVKLVVTDDNCKDSIIDVVTLFNNLTGDFTLDEPAGCYPLPVTFTSSSNATAGLVYDWSFGDGGTSTEANPTHTYLANGYYNVSLTMMTTMDCIDTITIVKDSAVFISLDSSMNQIIYDPFPTAGCAPLDVQFTNNSIFEGNATFTWTFGDGTSANETNPMHTYTENGYYGIGITMITLDKCVDTLFLFQDSVINVSLDSSTNLVNFDFFPKEGCLPLTVQFSDSSIYEGNADYFWDFGDGGLGTDQNPTNTYNDTGSYSIGLLLIPNEKCVDTLLKIIDDAIRVLPRPEAVINASDSALSIKEAFFSFNNAGSRFVQSSRYLIDGNEVSQSNVLDYQFTDTGHFTVSYIAVNALNCEDTSTAEVFVFDQFQFIIPNIFTPNGDRVNDEFRMIACGVYDYEIDIYNRFGIKVFRSNNMNINWDGRVDGRLANSGNYFYSIRIKDFRGEFLNYNGTITLLRD